MEDSTANEKQKPAKWKCKSCGNTVTLYIKVSDAPVCNNRKHNTKSVPMEQV